MQFNILEDGVWLGSESSLLELVHAIRNLQSSNSSMAQLFMGRDEEEEDEDGHYLLEKHGSVGVINIKGGLTNRSSWINQFLGLTAYPDIRDALITAVNDSEVQDILLDIDSPGGTANGISELAALLREVDSKMKPITAYTGGGMNSAAYWIGSQTRKIVASDMAEVGSIGAIVIHKEVTEMMRREGVGVNVIRAGRYKALGNPYEKLSDEAREEIEGKLDKFYSMFISAVADGRGVDPTEVRSRMAEGRVFLGTDALRVGLIDEVGFFDGLVAKLQSTGGSNRTPRGEAGAFLSSEAEGNGMKKRVAISKAAQAALASGASIAELIEKGQITNLSDEQQAALEQGTAEVVNAEEGEGGEDPNNPAGGEQPNGGDTTEEGGEEENTEEGEGTGEEGEGTGEEAEGEGEGGEEEAPTASATPGKGKGSNTVNLVQQLSGELGTIKAEKASLEKKLESVENLTAQFETVVREAAARLNVALGSSASVPKSLRGADLLEFYTDLKVNFEKNFEVGGATVIDDEEFTHPSKKVKTDSGPQGVDSAALQSTRFGKK